MTDDAQAQPVKHPVEYPPEGMNNRLWAVYTKKWQGFTSTEIGDELGLERSTIQADIRKIRAQYGQDWIPDQVTLVKRLGGRPDAWARQARRKSETGKAAALARMRSHVRTRHEAAAEMRKVADALVEVIGVRVESFLERPELVEELSPKDLKDLADILLRIYPLADELDVEPETIRRARESHALGKGGGGGVDLSGLVTDESRVVIDQLAIIHRTMIAEQAAAPGEPPLDVEAIEATSPESG